MFIFMHINLNFSTLFAFKNYGAVISFSQMYSLLINPNSSQAFFFNFYYHYLKLRRDI